MAQYFENAVTKSEGIEYSRYIMSWLNAKCDFTKYFGDDFKAWLKTHNLTDEEIHDVRFIAINGKFELEQSAIKFLREKQSP